MGNLVYTSGQIPIDPATGVFAEGGIKEQTRQSLANVKAILEEVGLTMSNVVKTTVFMADMNDFADMNSVYAEFFTEPYPARSAVAVKTLPKGVTGRTVVDYINQMLMMEASFLLRTSPMSITQIAERLHFADTPSFSKFFLRMKGVNPRRYRMEK